MSGLTMFPLLWLKKNGKNWTQFMFLIIISGVGNRMNMYDVKKMHRMSVSSRNATVERSPSLEKGNEQASFWKSTEFLQGM